MQNLELASVSAIADALYAGQEKSFALVERAIQKSRRFNRVINAVVQDRYDDALHEAAVADQLFDQARKAGTLDALRKQHPLLGVPCSIKESIQVQGMPNTAGLANRVGIVSSEDAPTVKALRDAGAVVLGVTNVSEACMWMESFNTVYGLTRNPYDPARTVGGSSGGEGAMVGSGSVPFGLGSDVGGSIRMPCFFNGVFGHKGSPHLVSNRGQFPASTGKVDLYLSTGPIARKASDLPFLLRILMGEDRHRLGSVDAVDVSKLRILRFEKERAVRVDKDQMGAVDRSVEALRALGATVQTIDLPLMAKAFDLWSAILADAGSEKMFGDHLFGSRAPSLPLKELIKLGQRRSDKTLPLVLLSLLEHIPEWFPKRNAALLKQAQQLHEQLTQALGDDGVLITVPYPTVAPKHYRALVPPFNFANCAIFNAMSMCATSVPTGLNAGGLPTGIQAVGNAGSDHLTLAVAIALEKALGGWVPPALPAA